jgi:hypothetical protein
MKVTFHENSHVDYDMFHIRVRGVSEDIGVFLSAVREVVLDGFYAKRMASHKVNVEDCILGDDGYPDWAFGSIDNGAFWNLERGADGKIVFDMNVYKGEGDDYLDRTNPLALHDTFWIEPANIIRAMTGKH